MGLILSMAAICRGLAGYMCEKRPDWLRDYVEYVS